MHFILFQLLNVDTVKVGDSDDTQQQRDSTMEQDKEPPVFDPSRFSDDQLMSKKSMKRKREHAKRNIDVSVVLGESSSSDPKKQKTDAELEEFNYEEADSSAFGKARVLYYRYQHKSFRKTSQR